MREVPQTSPTLPKVWEVEEKRMFFALFGNDTLVFRYYGEETLEKPNLVIEWNGKNLEPTMPTQIKMGEHKEIKDYSLEGHKIKPTLRAEFRVPSDAEFKRRKERYNNALSDYNNKYAELTKQWENYSKRNTEWKKAKEKHQKDKETAQADYANAIVTWHESCDKVIATATKRWIDEVFSTSRTLKKYIADKHRYEADIKKHTANVAKREKEVLVKQEKWAQDNPVRLKKITIVAALLFLLIASPIFFFRFRPFAK
jgi:hypothetical protein